MTRADMRAMQSIRDRILGSIVLPPGRFFTPKPAFWAALLEIGTATPGLTLMDCGAGSGDLIQEATDPAYGLKDVGMVVVGCDIMDREDQASSVLRIDATRIRWTSSYWPLICRPNHDGWATDVVSNAITQGARAIYVSKPSNFHQDVGGLPIRRFARNVGEAGETMYITE